MQNSIVKTGRKYAVVGSTLASGLMASFMSHADVAADIAAAQAAAETNLGLAIGAVITIAALSFGVGAIVAWMRK
ncbi:hypothetical protein [Shewanella sp.]|jgi:hypothetical protein|uniref:hypothetical protein n=1 Tax=Shewanella sp. TaxID=50422 RepID=UPI0040539062